jgi:hypothetical protein
VTTIADLDTDRHALAVSEISCLLNWPSPLYDAGEVAELLAKYAAEVRERTAPGCQDADAILDAASLLEISRTADEPRRARHAEQAVAVLRTVPWHFAG